MSALLATNRLALVDADLHTALSAQVVHCRANAGGLVVTALAALGGGSVGFALGHVVEGGSCVGGWLEIGLVVVAVVVGLVGG